LAGDVALGEDSGRHLVEQRLEEMVIGAVDHRDLDRHALQSAGGEEPSKPTTDNYDPVPVTGHLVDLPKQTAARPRGLSSTV
jgi:hypothetical protein